MNQTNRHDGASRSNKQLLLFVTVCLVTTLLLMFSVDISNVGVLRSRGKLGRENGDISIQNRAKSTKLTYAIAEGPIYYCSNWSAVVEIFALKDR